MITALLYGSVSVPEAGVFKACSRGVPRLSYSIEGLPGIPWAREQYVVLFGTHTYYRYCDESHAKCGMYCQLSTESAQQKKNSTYDDVMLRACRIYPRIVLRIIAACVVVL